MGKGKLVEILQRAKKGHVKKRNKEGGATFTQRAMKSCNPRPHAAPTSRHASQLLFTPTNSYAFQSFCSSFTKGKTQVGSEILDHLLRDLYADILYILVVLLLKTN